MKVAIVTPRYPPSWSGGGEKSVKLLTDNIKQKKKVTKVEVFSFDGESQSEVDGVKINRNPEYYKLPRELSNLLAINKLDRLSEFDIVHSYNMTFHPVVGWLSEKYDYRSVATLNNYQYICDSELDLGWNIRPLRKAYKRVSYSTLGKFLLEGLRKIDVYISLSNVTKDIYSNDVLSQKNIITIPNMLDPSFTHQNHSKKRGDVNNILYVGAIKKIKGVQFLVESVKHLSENFNITIVGDGPLLNTLKERARQTQFGKQITFEGFVEYDDLKQYYIDSDLFVHPGIWPEPFGRTLIEAMQFDLPIVATDIGGPSEIVPNPELLCESRSSKEIAAAIQRASTLQVEPGFYADYVNKTYSVKTIVNRILNLYNRV